MVKLYAFSQYILHFWASSIILSSGPFRTLSRKKVAKPQPWGSACPAVALCARSGPMCPAVALCAQHDSLGQTAMIIPLFLMILPHWAFSLKEQCKRCGQHSCLRLYVRISEHFRSPYNCQHLYPTMSCFLGDPYIFDSLDIFNALYSGKVQPVLISYQFQWIISHFNRSVFTIFNWVKFCFIFGNFKK